MTLKNWKQWVSAALACGGLASVSTSAMATLTTYADEASFLAAAGTVKTETFNGITTDISFVSASYDAGDFVVKNGLVDTPTTAISIDGTANLFVVLSYGGWSELKFEEPIKAFGAWFGGTGNFGTITVAADSLAGPGSYQALGTVTPGALSGSSVRFIGFTADQAFNRIVFEGALCCSSQIAIDNISYAGVVSVPAPVPEPASVPLALAGLGLVAALRVKAARKPSTDRRSSMARGAA
jgi:hypothetical protein